MLLDSEPQLLVVGDHWLKTTSVPCMKLSWQPQEISNATILSHWFHFLLNLTFPFFTIETTNLHCLKINLIRVIIL
jgi:hypothetical protein